ncbi:daunorubicin C-13 ketoreductase [Colletotrichum plurivorum]|uniref:Daunorubicin C-13 ketoreductase n=1 Tax=Colletotrichum plurivorum TaxID=2175906 RepID=A0A8H6KIP4_9PEZI|nr:daunorubicin C-13 ketoreductase [Colletotrichum plurivorum]
MTEQLDLRGKIALVTGANAGIGLATVRSLASRGAKVYMACRSEARSQAAIERLHEEKGLSADQVLWLPLDLGDPESVARAVDDMTTHESRLDILINNAGLATDRQELNRAGWDLTMAKDHGDGSRRRSGGNGESESSLRDFVPGVTPREAQTANRTELTSVLPLTKLSSAIISVVPGDLNTGFTSPTFLAENRTFSNFQTWLSGILAFRIDMPRYALAKLANVLFAKELQRRLDTRNIPIISTSMHPGGAATDAIPYVFRWLVRPLVRPLVWLTAISADAAAAMPVFAAVDLVVREKKSHYQGGYLFPPGTVAAAHPAAEDEEQLRGLWENTLLQLNEYLATVGLSPLEGI